MKTTAIILSGGRGLRFGTDVPKQYVNICGKPVLYHTLRAFEASNADDIVIVARDEYIGICGNIAADCKALKVSAIISGGDERYYSVLNGLNHIEESGAREQVVLIHDGARPLITPDTINRIIDDTLKYGAVIAAAPSTDTIKIVDDRGCIIETTDRQRTWAAQTPQSFIFKDIFEAYRAVFCDEPAKYQRKNITDDAMVYQMVFPGKDVRIVDAGRDNIKITTFEDAGIAENILSSRAT